MRSTDDERSTAERVCDADTDLVSTDARVDDLAYRLIIVLRRARWKMSDMTDCPGLDTVATLIVAGIGARNTNEDTHDRRRGAEQQSAVERGPLTRGWHCERLRRETDVSHSNLPFDFGLASPVIAIVVKFGLENLRLQGPSQPKWRVDGQHYANVTPDGGIFGRCL